MQRTQHMGEEERLLLLDLITQRRDVILSRATDARMIPVKAQAWEQVTNSLASSGMGPTRTVKQVKKIWENMRSRAKKFVSDQKKKFYRTGGGPPSPDIKPDAVIEKILALIADELEPAPNYNDSDSWPRGADVTDIYFDEVGEQTSEPMTEEPSTAHMAPASLIPVEGNDHSPLPSTSSVTLFGSTPLPSTSREAPGTVAFTHSSSNQRRPLPPTSVQASVPAMSPSELPPIQPSITSKRIGKKFKARKRKVEDSASRDSYETLSKFQNAEHDMVMKIHEQTLETKRKEREMLDDKKKMMDEKREMMSSLYSEARNALEDVRAATGAFIDFLDNFKKDQA
ncbi:hypothetical protein Pcinc_023052 [Petrolisthes cinctipes]|uniref:Regulatory protein zeste n=1 Tax=Petrolisthes cinctipes TaxID=88211 RepID=A0AAE1KCR1_PETCI|nr:hypothetical protein Pcinc_023052 [Petrolisthes cinctipes]